MASNNEQKDMETPMDCSMDIDADSENIPAAMNFNKNSESPDLKCGNTESKLPGNDGCIDIDSDETEAFPTDPESRDPTRTTGNDDIYLDQQKKIECRFPHAIIAIASASNAISLDMDSVVARLPFHLRIKVVTETRNVKSALESLQGRGVVLLSKFPSIESLKQLEKLAPMMFLCFEVEGKSDAATQNHIEVYFTKSNMHRQLMLQENASTDEVANLMDLVLQNPGLDLICVS